MRLQRYNRRLAGLEKQIVPAIEKKYEKAMDMWIQSLTDGELDWIKGTMNVRAKESDIHGLDGSNSNATDWTIEARLYEALVKVLGYVPDEVIEHLYTIENELNLVPPPGQDPVERINKVVDLLKGWLHGAD